MAKRKDEPAVLRDLIVEFGSLVDDPANKDARVMLFKRNEATDVAAPPDVAVQAVTDTLEKVGAKMSRTRLQALKAAVQNLNRLLMEVGGASDDEEDDDEEGMGMKGKEKAEKRDDAEKVEAAATAEKPVEKVTEPSAETPQPDADLVAKMQAERDVLMKRLEAAEEMAKAEREARLTREWIEKARVYSHLPTTADAFGPVLKRANESLSAEDFAELERLFKAADEHIAKSALYTDAGRSVGASEDSASARLNKLAQALVDEGKVKHFADAISKLSRDPEHRGLISDYLSERH